jgi:hypothetical protein
MQLALSFFTVCCNQTETFCTRSCMHEAGGLKLAHHQLDPEKASLPKQMPPELGCHAAPLQRAQKCHRRMGPTRLTQLGYGAFYDKVDGGAHKVCTQATGS